MQLKVAKIVNQIMFYIFVIIAGLAVGAFVLMQTYPGSKLLIVAIFLLVSIFLMFAFRWLESSWDKRVVTKMVQSGNIALVNIQSAARVMKMRDSGFVSYWLYEFNATLYPPDGEPFEKKFYEKMNVEMQDIPTGMLYVTYDETKPNQIFIIPNDLISHLPSLAPIVQKFESNKSIQVKYLDVYYKNGIVIRTFKESVAEHAAKKTTGEK